MTQKEILIPGREKDILINLYSLYNSVYLYNDICYNANKTIYNMYISVT